MRKSENACFDRLSTREHSKYYTLLDWDLSNTVNTVPLFGWDFKNTVLHIDCSQCWVLTFLSCLHIYPSNLLHCFVPSKENTVKIMFCWADPSTHIEHTASISGEPSKALNIVLLRLCLCLDKTCLSFLRNHSTVVHFERIAISCLTWCTSFTLIVLSSDFIFPPKSMHCFALSKTQ